MFSYAERNAIDALWRRKLDQDEHGLPISARHGNYFCADAATVLPTTPEVDLAFIDCEKSDYIRFFDMLRIAPGGFVVADNMLSHSMTEYVHHVRSRPGTESITLPIGKGLELTRFVS